MNTLIGGLVTSVSKPPMMSGLSSEVLDVAFVGLYMTITPICKSLYLHAGVESSFFLNADVEVQASVTTGPASRKAVLCLAHPPSRD